MTPLRQIAHEVISAERYKLKARLEVLDDAARAVVDTNAIVKWRVEFYDGASDYGYVVEGDTLRELIKNALREYLKYHNDLDEIYADEFEIDLLTGDGEDIMLTSHDDVAEQAHNAINELKDELRNRDPS